MGYGIHQAGRGIAARWVWVKDVRHTCNEKNTGGMTEHKLLLHLVASTVLHSWGTCSSKFVIVPLQCSGQSNDCSSDQDLHFSGAEWEKVWVGNASTWEHLGWSRGVNMCIAANQCKLRIKMERIMIHSWFHAIPTEFFSDFASLGFCEVLLCPLNMPQTWGVGTARSLRSNGTEAQKMVQYVVDSWIDRCLQELYFFVTYFYWRSSRISQIVCTQAKIKNGSNFGTHIVAVQGSLA